MQNKGGIIALAVVVALLCLYNLSFTLKSRSVQQDAQAFAQQADGTVSFARKQTYLDSIWRQPVLNLGFANYTYQEVKERELKLGLDLQGGMNVTLEVSPVEIIRVLSSNSKDPAFLESLEAARQAQITSQRDFVGLFRDAFEQRSPEGRLSTIFANSLTRDRLDLNASNDEVVSLLRQEVDEAVERSFQIIRTRVDQFGTTQPNIQRIPGTGRIQVEIPGADDPERVRNLLSGVAKLEFLEVYEIDEFGPYLDGFAQFLTDNESSPEVVAIVGSRESRAAERPAATNAADPFAASDSLSADDPFAEQATVRDDTLPAVAATPLIDSDSSDLLAQLADSAALDTADQFSSLVSELFVPMGQGALGANVLDTAKINRLLALPKARSLFPSSMHFHWGHRAFESNDRQSAFVEMYVLKRGRDGKAALGGDVVTNARQDINEKGQPEISMTMSPVGARKWRELTAANIGKRVAIVLDERVYSAPVVQGEIPNGTSSITGSYSLDEAKDLANILKAGKLPAPTQIVEEAIVGPSLGREAIAQGITSIAVGLGLVVLFMLFYYSTGGLVANVALLTNIFFIIGILAQFGAALTLPGIAGIVLTIGMSVDANVLIFERIKEELLLGRKAAVAIQEGYNKAFSSIIDANITTFLTGAILFYFGSGPIKGFAVTLMVGIACSFFTAVFVTRIIVEAALRRNRTLSFSAFLPRDLFQSLRVNVISTRRTAYIASGALIVTGIVLMLTQGLNFGVDFTGGRAFVVQFDQPVPASEVKVALTSPFENAGTEAKTYGANSVLRITTSYLVNDASQEADDRVAQALLTGLEKYADLNPEIISTSKVGASIADDIKAAAQTSVLLALAVIFLYIFVRFSSWQFGLGSVVALFHDVLMVLSLVAIARLLGFAIEIDQVFIAAMLTVVGYSINNTVVIFDRIREYIHDNPRLKPVALIDDAVSSTLSRTIITSLTTLMVVLILFLFGGEVLRGFSFALLIGIIVGTYSSLFIAPGIIADTTKEAPLANTSTATASAAKA